MRLSRLAGSAQILATGLIAGIFLGIRWTAAGRFSLDAASFVKQQQIIHMVFSRMMPPLVIAAILAGVICLIAMRKQVRSAGFALAAIATVCTIAALILTITVSFPLNDLLMTWDAASPPANAKDLWLPWESAHTIRTAIFGIAFIAAIAANSLFRDET
jgi:uncharacterized membrane protein